MSNSAITPYEIRCRLLELASDMVRVKRDYCQEQFYNALKMVEGSGIPNVDSKQCKEAYDKVLTASSDIETQTIELAKKFNDFVSQSK